MKLMTIAVTILIATAAGCSPDPKSGKGFTLPTGDVNRGQQAFAQLQCQACHTVAGVAFDEIDRPADQNFVALGGAKAKVQTYGDLVTSIINPSHRVAKGLEAGDIATDGKSKMRLYNDELTVQQLIDLVAFLESQYSIIQYDPTPYGPDYF